MIINIPMICFIFIFLKIKYPVMINKIVSNPAIMILTKYKDGAF